MESQCLGLAEALGIDPILKRVNLRQPWSMLSPFVRVPPSCSYTRESGSLEPPWPDLLIASGRQSVQASIFVHKQSRHAGQPCVTVQIQNPVVSPRHFDLVITPAHDQLRGPNVLTTLGALHRVTPRKLAQAAPDFLLRIGAQPRPYISVLIGGANGAFRFSAREMEELLQALIGAARACGGTLLITPSRRTGDAQIELLHKTLEGIPAFVWDGTGENPYFGMLAVADQVVVTADSVNMVSEAVATGKPVQVFGLPGGSAKFSRFHAALRAKGLTTPFPGPPPRPVSGIASDMERAVAGVRAAFRAVRGTSL
ncbi:MAG: mitochondrial fission ELM1 family protein [Alphaproteobacteria bacterium]|nr:mitochondrial fission ELM1 family protein [Alphaproteobacteria bacterium]